MRDCGPGFSAERRSFHSMARSNPSAAGAAPGGGGHSRRSALGVEEAAQPLRARRVPELAQRLGFYLADALAGDVELLADLLQRVVGVHFDAEAHAQHLSLAR